MQITTRSNNLESHMNEYQIISGVLVCGKVVIRDKTNGLAKVIFSPELTMKNLNPTYEIIINNKILLIPTYADLERGTNLRLIQSEKITFKQKGNCIKITEIDRNSRNIVYVDTANCVADKAYMFFSYLPRDLTREEALKKIPKLSEFTDFKPKLAAFNRYGVVIFGCDSQSIDFAGLYWADPYDEIAKEIQISDCFCLNNLDIVNVKSETNALKFEHYYGIFTLNHLIATKIDL